MSHKSQRSPDTAHTNTLVRDSFAPAGSLADYTNDTALCQIHGTSLALTLKSLPGVGGMGPLPDRCRFALFCPTAASTLIAARVSSGATGCA